MPKATQLVSDRAGIQTWPTGPRVHALVVLPPWFYHFWVTKVTSSNPSDSGPLQKVRGNIYWGPALEMSSHLTFPWPIRRANSLHLHVRRWAQRHLVAPRSQECKGWSKVSDPGLPILELVFLPLYYAVGRWGDPMTQWMQKQLTLPGTLNTQQTLAWQVLGKLECCHYCWHLGLMAAEESVLNGRVCHLGGWPITSQSCIYCTYH